MIPGQRSWKKVLRWFHILPNGELLRREREEAAERRKIAHAERLRRVQHAEKLAEKVRSGDPDAPMSLESYLVAVGLTPEQRERIRDRADRERRESGREGV